MVMDSEGITDLTALQAAPAGLAELSLLGLKNLKDIAAVDRLAGLRTLILWNDEALGDLSSLAALKQLRWVGLPPKTTQEQFAAFVGAHPDLTILDMMGTTNVTSLAPVRDLKSLQGLVLDGKFVNLDVVKGLTSLRFVGISKATLEASPGEAAAIRKALPDAMVVPVKPFCLGSGWILLLVPVLAVCWVLRRMPRGMAQPV